jgi:hypothetical protein
VPADRPDLVEEAHTLAVGAMAEHRVVPVEVEGMVEALATSPVPLSTMGRDLREDPAAFVAGAVAGRHAGRLADQVRS